MSALVVTTLRADEPEAELLPPPRVSRLASIPPTVVVAPPMYLRTNRYDVWQNYEVDRRGFFRTRVIESPAGSYYHHSGEPYPWTTVRPLWRAPAVAD